MYATIRTYIGDRELADQLAGYAREIEELISGIQGFRSYVLIRTTDGCTTVTVCDDKAGAEESTRIASQWLQEHASEIKFTPPEIRGGEVLVQLDATARV